MASYNKLYFCRQQPPYTPPTIRGTWNESGIGPVNVLDGRKDAGGFRQVRTRPDSSTTSPYAVMLSRCVSLPLDGDQTIDGNFNVSIGVAESNAAADMHWKIHMYVTQGNSDTVRGTLVNNYTEAAGVNEFPTTVTGHALNAALALTSVSALSGDRIVIEIGFIAYNSVSTAYNGSFAHGTYQTATAVYADQVVGSATAGASYVEFSNAIDFTIPAAPANDTCATATTISSLPYSDTQEISSANGTGDPVASWYTPARTVWYKWTAPSDLWVTITTAGSTVRDASDTLTNQTTSVLVGSCGSQTYQEYVTGTSTPIRFRAASGTTYYIMVGSTAVLWSGTIAISVSSEAIIGGPPPDGPTVVYEQTWQTTFSRDYAWQQHTPAGGDYEPLTGYPFPNGIAEAENIGVASVGTMDAASLTYGGGYPYTSCGCAFYGIGEDDPNRLLVNDEGYDTYAWDQRGVIIKVDYNFKTGVMEEESVYYPLVLAKGLFESTAPFILQVYGDSWDEFSRRWLLKYWTGNPGSQVSNLAVFGNYVPDNAWHTLTVQAQPGTVTGDPLAAGCTIASDGFIHIWIDSTPLFQIDNIQLTFGFGNSWGTDLAKYVSSPVYVRSLWQGFYGLLGPTRNLRVTKSGTVTVPPMQRASYVFFSNHITEKQTELRLTRSFLQLLVSDPDYSNPGPEGLTLTQITGNLYNQNGSIVTSGRLYFTPRNFITVGGTYLIAPKTVTYNVSGAVNFYLAGSNGVLYDVEFDPDPNDPRPANLKLGYWRDVWSVPNTGPVNISTL